MIQQPDSPDALMSYTRIDDQHHKHYLTLFREQLSGEVSVQIGRKFHIFQDTEDIKWGEQFEQRIDNVLQSITFFVPILTPSFFNSKFCRYELKCFLEHEKQLGRNDLVLPVYFIRVPALEKPALCVNDPLAHALAARQRIDWRNLRFETFESSEVRRKLAQMAQHIADALEVPTNTVINELSGLERIESVWDDVVIPNPGNHLHYHHASSGHQ
jgi:F-box protein 11